MKVYKEELISPILDVYLKRVDERVIIKPVYPPERNSEIAECRNKKLKICKYTDWQLLSEALKNSFNLSLNSLSFSKTECGKWISDEVYFSLSHSGNFVCVAVSNMPVGIDIEVKEAFFCRWKDKAEKLGRLAQKTYTREELERTESLTLSDFLKKWTLKEAIFKREGKGEYRPGQIESYDKNSAVFGFSEPALPLVAVSGANLTKVRFYTSESTKPEPVEMRPQQ